MNRIIRIWKGSLKYATPKTDRDWQGAYVGLLNVIYDNTGIKLK